MICSTNQLTGFYMMAILAFNELNEYIKFTFPKETKETILKYYKSFSPYNLGQKVVDKFTKLSKIGVSVECFTADFLRYFTEKYYILPFVWTAGYLPSNPNIYGIFLKFPNFLRS